MRSHAMDKWAKRKMNAGGYVTETGRGEVEKLGPVVSFVGMDDEDDEDDDMCYAFGGAVENNILEPSFKLSIMQDPENVHTSEDGWDEEKDLEDEEALDGEPLRRTPRGFDRGGFIMALRKR